MQTQYEVIVVGGGITGAAIGYGLAKRGVNVCVMDSVPTHSRASRANMGLVWCQSKALGCPAYVRWGFESSRLYGALADEIMDVAGIDIGYSASGGIIPCLGEAELTQRSSMIDKLRAETSDGVYPAKTLSRAELQQMLPKVDFGPEVSGGIWCSEDGIASPLLLMFGLRRSFVRRGGTLLTECRVREVRRDGGGYVLTTSQGVFGCEKLVLAAGLGTRALGLQLGADIPVYPNRSQVLLLERIPDILPIPLLGIARTKGGTVMIGAAHENAGMDMTLRPEIMSQNAAWAMRVWPRLSALRVIRFWTGLRVWPKDAYPIYDRLPGHDNVYVFAMHSALTLAAALEHHMPGFVCGEPLHPDAEPMKLSRFDNGGKGFAGFAACAPQHDGKAKQ